MSGFSKEEAVLVEKLNTPAKIQDFLNSLEFNFEKNGETLKSPLFVLHERKGHCFEGALLGAYILSLHGFVPYLLHLKATDEDYDHVIVPFKVGRLWGALSKTNHAVLRYREPVYESIRELALSYFHEYFLNDGRKTLRQYSSLLNLNKVGKDWWKKEGDLWWLDKKLDKVKHYKILPKNFVRKLRKADKIEIQAGRIIEFKKHRK